MAETLQIQPSNLLIDAENPRLPQPNEGQRDAQRALAQHQQRKLVALAGDIVLNGLNPADLPIVMATNDDSKRYFVLEGNRRLAALRALENPDTLVGAVENSVVNELRALSKIYQAHPIEHINCLVVKDRQEARHWIELRHTGENQGAGIVPWGSDESARFKARSGGIEIHTQALNFLETHGHLTPEKRTEVPVTSFKRLLGTPEVRAKCGIDLQNGKLIELANPKRIAKALMHIVEDLASSNTKTEHIYTREDRIAYANSMPGDVVIHPTMKKGKALFRGKKFKPAKPTLPRVRDILIPTDCVLAVSDARIAAIENELRQLNLDNFTNAISVVFRVFIELSLDDYIDAKNLSLGNDDTLRNKMQVVVTDLLNKRKLTSKQATPVRRAMAKDSFLAPSITLLHQFVHCQHVFPTPSDLRAHWDSLQPFLVAIWSP